MPRGLRSAFYLLFEVVGFFLVDSPSTYCRPPKHESTTFFISSTQSLLINMGIGLFAIISIVALIYVIRSKKNPNANGNGDFFANADTQIRLRTNIRKQKKTRSRPFETSEPKDEPAEAATKPNTKPDPSSPEMIVTEKTRVQINHMLMSITSIKAAEKIEPASATEQEVKGLETSELVQALTDTLISEPKIENSSIGKFSKMTVDGSLLFDEGPLISEEPKKEKK